ncbi:transmembrane anchor protein [Shimia sp. R10_1]|uniref:transmembrane anchor protein n=1 Tax=Shimia sp. R10_1 TaxID=2821095 RepID=UPI001ADBBE40|nr:transmembrane anchor protein [Shimia sp. R10_1]MBO9473456.1 transmembrane anchor protein [Shimia sp. R10_1]
MFNSNKPTLEELPTTAQLLTSTFIAAASALVILITVVLPAEYGIDPTRVGRLLGLAEMGEIKSQLATEAEEDRQRDASDNDQSNLLNDILGIFVSTAYAQEAVVWRDEVTFTLEPGASAEWKLEMTQGQSAQFRMIVDGGRVNFDLHGHGSGQSVTYEKGRGSTGSEGTILAEFDGAHGWFWRNRDKQAVTITVQVRGEYKAFKDAS